ncbi:hypothetical protein FY134_03035 [Agrobacterium fabrum]|uniref:hypothetical protein n=1 Tax=Agrobacterium fabrum TaxID=1176649 RepID=UPI0021CE264B|nr:hypothetical protein [Agrobacterium fabrum]UXT56673.1 hypothetical protein FY134_03035 [Agrobacterium fabrum]
MTHTINVSVDYDTIVTDALAVILAFYPSGEPIGDMVSLEDYQDDAQFTLLYEFLVASHVRALICRATGNTINCRVATAHWLGEQSYAEVEFATKADAVLFKLAHP